MMLKRFALVLALAATPVAAAESTATPPPCCSATINAPPQVWQTLAQFANDSLPTKYGLPLLQQITKQVQPQIDAANAKVTQPKTTKPTVEK